MANTYVNKVQLADGTSLIDISDSTVTADKILQGYTAYGADGQKLTGTATGSGGVTVTDVANTTGTTCVITTGSEPTPSETWETLYRGNVGWWLGAGDVYPYCWITDSTLIQVQPSISSIWRVTFDDAVYRLTAKSASSSLAIGLGNPKYVDGTDDGSDVPFCIGYYGYDAWSGNADVEQDSNHFMKIERLVTT